MKNKTNSNIKTFVKKGSDNTTRDYPFLVENPINTLSTNSEKRVQKNNQVLNLIKERQPITPYSLTKLLPFSYTEVCRVVRDLEYCGLIQIKVIIGENTRAKKLLFIPELKTNAEQHGADKTAPEPEELKE